MDPLVSPPGAVPWRGGEPCRYPDATGRPVGAGACFLQRAVVMATMPSGKGDDAREVDGGWRVREVDGAKITGASGPRCLVFESRDVMRVVWQYPAEWRELSDEQLMALSWGR